MYTIYIYIYICTINSSSLSYKPTEPTNGAPPCRPSYVALFEHRVLKELMVWQCLSSFPNSNNNFWVISPVFSETQHDVLGCIWHFLTVVGYTSPFKWLMFFPTIREASGWRWRSPGAKSGPVDPQWAPAELRQVSKNHGLCLSW